MNTSLTSKAAFYTASRQARPIYDTIIEQSKKEVISYSAGCETLCAYLFANVSAELSADRVYIAGFNAKKLCALTNISADEILSALVPTVTFFKCIKGIKNDFQAPNL